MSDLTLMVLLDAFRPDYFARTRFLRTLAAGSATGQLRECFGFVPRAAYFAGLNAEQFGFTNMFCYDPQRSPFRAAKSLPRGADPRAALNEAARKALPPFAAQYASSFEIPPEHAALFDVVEKRAPWDKKVGYRSLFHVLEARGLPWHQTAWPDTNRLPDHSDAGIVRAALAELKPEHRFAYVHLQELDSAGHLHGPNSAQLQRVLENTDRAVERLVTELRSRYDQVNLIVFGDHGMVNVTRTLDVWVPLNATGLTFGRDYVFFLDSTMARFWFLKKHARPVVEQCLATLTGGRVLTAEDLQHYGIGGCDKRNGELYFLADPGVLIVPNFFQSNGDFTRGMHGYDPDCPDNLGGFLLNVAGQPELAGTTLGQVNPTSLYPTLLDLLGLGDLISAHQPSLRIQAQPARIPVYTLHPDPRAEAAVAAQLERVMQAVVDRIGEPEAIVLAGSFGRGEGAVTMAADGGHTAYNDIDLVIVDKANHTDALRELSAQLSARLGIDFVDLAYSDGQWGEAPATIFNYDLRYGSRVIRGNADVLNRLPAYASADLPAMETVTLLLNRTLGVLSGLKTDFLATGALSQTERRYLTYQLIKAFTALGDAAVTGWGGYDSSYAVRRDRFEWLARGAGLDESLISHVVWAYNAKLNLADAEEVDVWQLCHDLASALESALVTALNALTGAAEVDVFGAMARYAEFMPDRAQVLADNFELQRHPALQPALRATINPNYSIRQTVYAAGPLLLVAAFDPERRATLTREAAWHLQSYFNVTAPVEAWEALRAEAVRLWLDGIIH
jgi:hypothetical protein